MKAMARKRCLFVLGCLAALAFLLSCGGGEERFAMPVGEAHQTLSEIDSLMWRQPDSAFLRLQEFSSSSMADSLDTFDQHYFQLLISELLYKNYLEQTNRSELLQAAGYFDTLSARHGGNKRIVSTDNLVFLDARVHYIKGVGLYERDSVLEACGEYLKALEIMEERFEEKELMGQKAKFMALAHTHLCSLFSDQYLHQQAIAFGRKSLPYYYKCKSSNYSTAWVLDEIGSHYDMTYMLDSAEYYYKNALVVLNDTISLLYRDILAHITFLQYKKQQMPDSCLPVLHLLRSKAENELERLARCLSVGEIHYQETNFDSAVTYFCQVFEKSERMEPKLQAATWLEAIYLSKGDLTKANDCALAITKMTKNIGESETLHSDLTSLYNDYILHGVKNVQIKAKKTTLFWLAMIVVVLIIPSIVLQKKRDLDALRMDKELYAQMNEKKVLSGKLKGSNERMKAQTEELKQLKREIYQLKHKQPYKGDRNELYKEDICQEIMRRFSKIVVKRDASRMTYEGLAISSAQLNALASVVEKHFPGFTDYLSFLYPKVTVKDLDICRLLLLGLNKKQISLALECDYTTVLNHIHKLSKRFQINNELSDFIINPHLSIISDKNDGSGR